AAAMAFGNDAMAANPISNDCSAGYVEFTFDDGPGPYTPQTLQTLRDLNIKATFFVNGNKLETAFGQQTLRDAGADGHSVQNHTYDHQSFTGASTMTAPLTEDQARDELERASAAIVAAGAPRPTLYRPPYGDVNAYYDLIARNLGYRIVMPWGSKANI